MACIFDSMDIRRDGSVDVGGFMGRCAWPRLLAVLDHVVFSCVVSEIRVLCQEFVCCDDTGSFTVFMVTHV